MTEEKRGIRFTAIIAVCIVAAGGVLGACESTVTELEGGSVSDVEGRTVQEQVGEPGRHAGQAELPVVTEGLSVVEDAPDRAYLPLPVEESLAASVIEPEQRALGQTSVRAERSFTADRVLEDSVELPALAPGEELWIIAPPDRSADDPVGIEESGNIEDTHPGSPPRAGRNHVRSPILLNEVAGNPRHQ